MVKSFSPDVAYGFRMVKWGDHAKNLVVVGQAKQISMSGKHINKQTYIEFYIYQLLVTRDLRSRRKLKFNEGFKYQIDTGLFKMNVPISNGYNSDSWKVTNIRFAPDDRKRDTVPYCHLLF